MYIENVRNALKSFSAQERYELANLTKQILVRDGRINESVRPSEIEKYMKNFINRKETKMKYLEGFRSNESVYTSRCYQGFVRKTNVRT